jgi:hypothetical protein
MPKYMLDIGSSETFLKGISYVYLEKRKESISLSTRSDMNYAKSNIQVLSIIHLLLYIKHMLIQDHIKCEVFKIKIRNKFAIAVYIDNINTIIVL